MAVVYSYYRYIIDKENNKCYVFRNNYGKERQKKLVACLRKCCKALAITLCVIVILVAISEIVVAFTNGLTTKLYSADLSGRLVAMTVLALTAAVSLAISIYAMVGFIKKEKKPLHITGVVLTVMAIIQALLCGIAVKVTTYDEITMANSLAKSFNLALEGNPRHTKIWDGTNSGFQCCGLNGPDDYKNANGPVMYAPDVPISCCRQYEPGRADILQEKEREECRAKRDYYYAGCGILVRAVFRNSASAVLSATISFIVLEVLLAATCWIVYRYYRKREKEQDKPYRREERNEVQLETDQGQKTHVVHKTQVSQEQVEVKIEENPEQS